MSQKQQTLSREIAFAGKGLHTGARVNMTLCPAEENTGIRFRRIDLEGEPVVEALAEYVTDTSRGTTIEKNGVKICTIEHVMAALWGCGIDNALVRIDAPEVPIMDGSAREYAAAILEAGVVEQNAEREYYVIRETTRYTVPEKGVEITVYPDEGFGIDVHIDYNSKVLGNQYAKMDSLDQFASGVAPCRTFVFLHELEPLLKNNLIRGGDLDNAIVVVENKVSPEEVDRLAALFDKKDIRVESSGLLNNLELRFLNEPARHKLLDMVGDLALAGRRIKGKVVASKPGHYANTEFAKMLRKSIKREGVRPRFRFGLNDEPVYDINQVRATLPHRPPFLLVDKIMHIDDSHVAGIKNVTMNEPFFVGHFPSEPVMPGVLIVEAMAQCGGILALHNVEDPENYSTYFMKIDGVKFKRKVVPGDTLQFELRLLEPIRRGIVLMEARAFVGEQLATEAVLMAQITKNKKN